MVIVARALELHVAVAKVAKYAASESGDTVEVIERPHGGLSLVLADGQSSGRAAKLISNIAARKIISLLADGVRDGAAARAAHDYLRTLRQGKVSAEVSIASVDLTTGTLVISRNTQCPAVIIRCAPAGGFETTLLDDPSEPIGIHPRTKPVINEIQLEAGLYALLFSDGLLAAGRRKGLSFDISAFACAHLRQDSASAETLAEALIAEAIALDDGRPADDISAAVLAVYPYAGPVQIRKMSVRFPF